MGSLKNPIFRGGGGAFYEKNNNQGELPKMGD